MPRYPFEFHQADALEFPLEGFDVVHASPPCQDHSGSSVLHSPHGTGWMLGAVLGRLQESGLPFVVENVAGAVMPSGLTLCGTVFGLGLHRHRVFQTSFESMNPGCDPSAVRYRGRDADVFGHHRNSDRVRREWRVEWMNRDEISQCIPPVFAEFIGEQLLAHLTVAA
jgi:DNA (cytosine-5)-methyltransferase 1